MLKIIHNPDNKSIDEFNDILKSAIYYYKGLGNFYGVILDNNYTAHGIESCRNIILCKIHLNNKIITIPNIYDDVIELEKPINEKDKVSYLLDSIIPEWNNATLSNDYNNNTDIILCYYVFD